MMTPASAGVSGLLLAALIAAAALPALGCGGVRAGAGAPRTRPAAAMTGAPGTAGLARRRPRPARRPAKRAAPRATGAGDA